MDPRRRRLIEEARAGRFNPMNDLLFKFIFGREEGKRFTIAFFNAVLEEELGRTIQDLTFAPQERSPERAGEKETRFDVSCVLDGGERVEVEVQVLDQMNMERRTLFYWGRLYQSGFLAGTDYRKLAPAISICILDFELFDDPDPHSAWGVCNLKTHERLNKDLSLHFLEIPKFERMVGSGRKLSPMERWMCFFSRKLSPEVKRGMMMNDSIVLDAMNCAGKFFHNSAEARRYVDAEIARMDWRSAMEGSWQKGRQEGRLEGRQEGRQEERKDVIRGMAEDGLPLERIARIMRMSLEQVAGIVQCEEPASRP